MEEFRQAALFGRADAVVLTGLSFEESLGMVSEVRQSQLTTPIYIGGGVNADNVSDALKIADGIIVSSAFKRLNGFTRDSMRSDWDLDKMKHFMKMVELSQ